RRVGVAAAVAVGRPLRRPRLAEGVAEHGLGPGGPPPVTKDDETERLAVRPRRRPAGGEQDRCQLGVGNRLGPKATDGPSGGQALEEPNVIRRQLHLLTLPNFTALPNLELLCQI